MAPTASVSTSVLLAQAGRPRPASVPRPDRTGPTGQVVVLAAAALLLLGVLVPRSGDYVAPPGSGPGASGSSVELVDGLPGVGAVTGRVPGGERADSGAAQSDAGTPVTGDAGGPGAGTRSSCTAPCTTSQTVSVAILPGPLTVSGPTDPVRVRTDDDGTGTGTLTGLTVTDTRGAAAGWTLASVVTVTDELGLPLPAARVEVVPRCTRTAGPLSLEDADAAVVASGEQASLCLVPTAAAGSLAGGVVVVTADVTVRDAPRASWLSVRFASSVA